MSDEKANREKRGSPEVPGGVPPKTVGPEQRPGGCIATVPPALSTSVMSSA